MTTVKSTTRYPWIDTSKSLALYLVVLGHLMSFGNLPLLRKIIYSFHMPLFFILSGYLYKYKEHESTLAFLKRKFNRLALPAILWIILTFPFFMINNENWDPKHILREMLFFDGSIPFNAPCWFFLSLFFVFVTVRLLRIDKGTTRSNLFLALCAFMVGFLMDRYNIPDCFMLLKTSVCTGFFLIGYTIRNKITMDSRHSGLIFRVVTIVGSFSLWIVLGVCFNTKVSIYSCVFGHYWSFILAGILGSYFFCATIKLIYDCIKKPIRKSMLERYPVKSSVLIICSHYVPVTLYEGFMASRELAFTWKYNLYTPVFALLLIIGYASFCKWAHLNLPILNGEAKNR